jgi:hypothetical protein
MIFPFQSGEPSCMGGAMAWPRPSHTRRVFPIIADGVGTFHHRSTTKTFPDLKGKNHYRVRAACGAVLSTR